MVAEVPGAGGPCQRPQRPHPPGGRAGRRAHRRRVNAEKARMFRTGAVWRLPRPHPPPIHPAFIEWAACCAIYHCIIPPVRCIIVRLPHQHMQTYIATQKNKTPISYCTVKSMHFGYLVIIHISINVFMLPNQTHSCKNIINSRYITMFRHLCLCIVFLLFILARV